MREEMRKETVVFRDVTVYIADDGTEFKHRSDCVNYDGKRSKSLCWKR